MDEQVLRSLIQWPNVPHCFGWLALDRRGQWRMRDEFAQQNKLTGSVIRHVALNEFIARNYARDTTGRYFFQNGPQRVFITLDATPWIVRLHPNANNMHFTTQCQMPFHPQGALSDELGNIYITGLTQQTIYTDFKQTDKSSFTQTAELSVALLHDHDLELFSELATIQEQACSFGGSWMWHEKALPLDPISANELCERFGFIKTPNA